MSISAMLLAGGESRRMSKDKATLLFGGKPLWQIQLELLCKLEPAEIFVSARADPVWRPAAVTRSAQRVDRNASANPKQSFARSGNRHALYE